VGAIAIAGVGVSDIEAFAVLVGSAMLAAVNTTFCAVVIVAGAVYNPFVTVPIAGVSDQVTPVLVVPLTEAVNCCACPALTDVNVGNTDIKIGVGGVRDIVADAAFVGSAILVAVNMTV
jgi:hypothetical protein